MKVTTRLNRSCAASAIFSAFSVCACCCQLTLTARRSAIERGGRGQQDAFFCGPDDEVVVAFERGAEERFCGEEEHHVIERAGKLRGIIAVGQGRGWCLSILWHVHRERLGALGGLGGFRGR